MDYSIALIILLLAIIIFMLFKKSPSPTPTPSPQPEPEPASPDMIGGCKGTRYGCCPNGITPRINYRGSNCM